MQLKSGKISRLEVCVDTVVENAMLRDTSTWQLVEEVIDPNITTINVVNKLHPREYILAIGISILQLEPILVPLLTLTHTAATLSPGEVPLQLLPPLNLSTHQPTLTDSPISLLATFSPAFNSMLDDEGVALGELIQALCLAGEGFHKGTIQRGSLHPLACFWSAFVHANISPCSHVSDLTEGRATILYTILTGRVIDVWQFIQMRSTGVPTLLARPLLAIPLSSPIFAG
ncbi:DNA damage-binding protein 2 [Vigna unguiculata]|uniref:DNA damage-binding protein 2 n=1 Tax=Vigna unguiculata TaxID=3917 RepID=A0A4D6MQG6_VIGUN|nr:DNA damage-binding protein 2 [Vigna unguiculata]